MEIFDVAIGNIARNESKRGRWREYNKKNRNNGHAEKNSFTGWSLEKDRHIFILQKNGLAGKADRLFLCLSPRLKFLPDLGMFRHRLGHKVPKFLGMIEFFKMAKFMDNDII
jgi:hypothetical protein